MNLKANTVIVIIFLGFFNVLSYDFAQATDSRSLTTTTQNQTIFTNGEDCRGNQGEICPGTIQTGGVTIPINGGMLNFNLCGEAINVNPTDVPVCRVTPPMIPPGADTQVGTGLNPIIGTGTDVGASFGGLTNDSVPSGTSNVTIPGFLIHGGTFLSNPMSGEVTNNCNSEATCGQTVNRNIITHFQSFRSVPNGGIIDPNVPSVFCDQPRCNHIEFSIQQDMTGAAAAQTAMRFDFVIDSKNDANGDIIVTAPGTPTGTFTVTCLPGSNACTNTSGNFRVNTSTFTSASTGFVTMNDSPVVNPVGCPTGTLVDPFHQNGVSCQSN